MIPALVLSATLLFGLVQSKSKVVELTPSNFHQLVINDNSVWLVQFYASWCGPCQTMKPEIKKLARISKGAFKVGMLDADLYRSFGQKYVTRGFPTILIFGANKHSPIEHVGPRTAEAMSEAVHAQVNNALFKQ